METQGGSPSLPAPGSVLPCFLSWYWGTVSEHSVFSGLLMTSSFPMFHISFRRIEDSPLNSVGCCVLVCPLRLRKKVSLHIRRPTLNYPYLTNLQPYAHIIIKESWVISGARNCHSMSYDSKYSFSWITWIRLQGQASWCFLFYILESNCCGVLWMMPLEILNTDADMKCREDLNSRNAYVRKKIKNK